MKFLCKALTFMLAAAMTLLLFACGTPALSDEPLVTEDHQEQIAESVTTGKIPPALAKDDYEYKYESGRDRDWENDIIYLAKKFCDQHAKLMSGKIPTSVMYQDTIYTDMSDKAVREEFLGEIYSIIDDIPELTDDEIICRLAKAVALLNDAHSSVGLASIDFWTVFSYRFSTFYSDDGYELRVRTAPADQSELLLSKLVSINGIPTEEVVERLSAYISAENIYFTLHKTEQYIFLVPVLQSAGIVDKSADTADFTFELDDGTVVTVTAASMTGDEWLVADLAKINPSESGMLMYKNSNLNYWYEYLPDDNMIYIRLNTCTEMDELSYSDFFNTIIEDEAFSDGVKVVIDVRGNGGGNYPMAGWLRFMQRLSELKLDGIYALIDYGTASGAVDTASELWRDIDGVVLVGTPAGEPPNFFGNSKELSLPNSGIYFTISQKYFIDISNYPYDALMPDITVYQTVEDYKNGVDTVMEAIKQLEAE